MLRFLSLELERIVDEQRIQAMKLLVERIRRRREAEESGTRQQEQRRRRADDELFRQVRVVQMDPRDALPRAHAVAYSGRTFSVINWGRGVWYEAA